MRITRLVKMTFAPGKREEFISIFNANKSRIAGFEGCEKLELGNDTASPDIFFTISRWRSEEDLENYRKSELFAAVWVQTKALFAAKAEAWTLRTEEVERGSSQNS